MLSQQNDFSKEMQLLNEVGRKPEPRLNGVQPTYFENMAVYSRFYQQADMKFSRERAIKKPRRLKGARCRSFVELPKAKNSHVRGFVEDQKFFRFDSKHDTRFQAGFVPACTFHSQPIGALADVPTFEDLFDFLWYSHLRHIVIGETTISVLDKTPESLAKTIELWEWQSCKANAYKFKRLVRRHPDKARQEIRNRWAKIALRGVKLVWPYKKSDVLSEWPEKVKVLGIEVSQIKLDRRSRALSVEQVLTKNATLADEARYQGVSNREFLRWIEAYREAGRVEVSSSKFDTFGGDL